MVKFAINMSVDVLSVTMVEDFVSDNEDEDEQTVDDVSEEVQDEEEIRLDKDEKQVCVFSWNRVCSITGCMLSVIKKTSDAKQIDVCTGHDWIV